MSTTRRRFLTTLPALGAAAAAAATPTPEGSHSSHPGRQSGATVLSTWNHGVPANAAALAILSAGGSALDAAEAGVRVTEADPTGQSVGIGGRPDQLGRVTLDACIMGPDGDCGSVAYVQHYPHPISIARAVMERTPHIMLVGDGAERFAAEQGFTRTELLTEASRREWEAWRADRDAPVRPPINVENHDTIGLLTLDANGNLAGACTTSGAAYKLPGRVGDSPLIGAGLYVDNAVGGATATGWGEAVIRACGSFLVVELMRQGMSPQEACEAAVARVVEKNPDWREIQVGFIALAKDGRHGAYCIAPGFEYALATADRPGGLFPAGARLAADGKPADE